ncbi:MAG: GntR family transcriptional regulator, partial [Oscillospiraceae bacterium]
MLEQEAYILIKDKIIKGIYPAGSVLSEIAVSEELGMSRTPMRSAINKLCSEGFITQKKGHFSTVRTITPKDIHNFFEYCLIVEEYAIRKMYENKESSALDLIKQANEKQRLALENHNIDEYYIADHEYHMAFINYLNNEEITTSIENMWEKISMITHAGHQNFKKEERN